MKFLKDNIVLITILTLAVALRFIKLGSIPIGFNDDEAAFGYNAYSILKTGRDEWGGFLPFPVFESFGDWKLIGYLYLTVVSQFIFGVNEFATRLPSALFGILSVWATYLLTKELFKDSNFRFEIARPAKPWRSGGNLKLEIGHVAALFLVISPWHIVASRNAFESDILIFFITISTYFFLKGLKKKQFLTFSFLGFVLSFYIYRSSWLFVPLFVLSLLYLHRDYFKKIRRNLIKNLTLALILLLPLIPTILTFKGQARFLQESFIAGIARTGINNEINEQRGACIQKFPGIICLISYSKVLVFSKIYLNNYFGNLSIKTYFDNASPTGFQSFMTRSVLYLFELPLIILGLVFLFKAKSSTWRILLPWMAFFPLGAAIAGVGNFGRINLFMPVPQVIVAYGLVATFFYLKNNFLKTSFVLLVSIIVIVATIGFISDLFLVEPYFTSRYQRYGYRQLFSYLTSKEQGYDKIVISRKIDYGHQYMQYLYFAKVDPNFFLANAARHKENNWVVFDSIGKYDFVSSVPGIDRLPTKTLIVTGQKEIEFPKAPIHVISDLRGDTIFEVYDVSQVKVP